MKVFAALRAVALAVAACLAASGCLSEPALPPAPSCTKGTAGCPCSADSECHDGTALGYASHGWTCQQGLCVAYQCVSSYDCTCQGSRTEKCVAGFCQCK